MSLDVHFKVMPVTPAPALPHCSALVVQRQDYLYNQYSHKNGKPKRQRAERDRS
jgi:hypothetical protein